jgi:hypothetical protein
MTSLSESLVAMLSANTTVYGLVGARIYHNRMPKTPTLPNIVYQRVSTGREHSHSGAGLLSPSWQIVCWARTTGDASALATAVEGALDGRINNGNLQAVLVEGRVEGDEPENDLNYVRLEVVANATKE